MVDTFAPRYYATDGPRPGDPDDYFRLSSGGVYHRWDRATKTWIHVTSKGARDWYSRAIENGDGAYPCRASDVK